MTHKSETKGQGGFTIVELLVVIVVVAILVTLTVVSYAAVTNNARKQAVKTDAQTIAAQLNKYKADKGSYPTDLAAVQSSAPAITSKFQYTYDSKTATYCVTASVEGASAYVKSGGVEAKDGACPGHGVNGSDPITNLASNPSAEVSVSGVSGYYSATPGRTYGGAVSGDYTFSTTTNSTTQNQGLIHTVTTSAKPNQVYTCAISLKGSGSTVAFSGRVSTAADVYIMEGLGAKSVSLTSSWQRVSITFTTPATTGVLRVQYRLGSALSGITIQSDALICTEGATDHPYADGSTANWIWNGTAHISSSTGPAL